MESPSRRPAQRAADTDREAAAALVQAAGGDGRLTLEELELRLGAVLSARTHAELDRLTADLGPGIAGEPAIPGRAPLPPSALEPDPAAPAHRRRRVRRDRRRSSRAFRGSPRATTVAVLGGVRQEGVWWEAGAGRLITVLGNATVDLRAAELAGVSDLRVLTVLGTTTLLIPDDIVVNVRKVAVLAEQDLDVVDRPRPTAGALRLSLVTVLGTVRLRSGPRPAVTFELYA